MTVTDSEPILKDEVMVPEEGEALKYPTTRVVEIKSTAADFMRKQDAIRQKAGRTAVGGCTIGTGLAV